MLQHPDPALNLTVCTVTCSYIFEWCSYRPHPLLLQLLLDYHYFQRRCIAWWLYMYSELIDTHTHSIEMKSFVDMGALKRTCWVSQVILFQVRLPPHRGGHQLRYRPTSYYLAWEAMMKHSVTTWASILLDDFWNDFVDMVDVPSTNNL